MNWNFFCEALLRSLALLASAGLGAEVDAGYIEGFVRAANRNALKPHAAKLFADASRVTRRLIDDLLKYKRLEGVEASLRLLSERLFSGGRQATVLREELARHGVGPGDTVRIERLRKTRRVSRLGAHRRPLDFTQEHLDELRREMGGGLGEDLSR